MTDLRPRPSTEPAHAALTRVRVGLVDDHDAVRIALRGAIEQTPDLRVVAAAPTVERMLSAAPEAPELVVLDLRLRDGSSPMNNVERLVAAGCRVLVYTSGESRFLLRAVARTEVIGVVRKSEPIRALTAALRAAADGRTSIDPVLAASIANDPRIQHARLSPHEQRILSLFADGHTAQRVADDAGIAVSTVEDYIRRIRAKYASAGRTAVTKVDLYKRAIEDGFLPAPHTR